MLKASLLRLAFYRLFEDVHISKAWKVLLSNETYCDNRNVLKCVVQ